MNGYRHSTANAYSQFCTQCLNNSPVLTATLSCTQVHQCLTNVFRSWSLIFARRSATMRLLTLCEYTRSTGADVAGVQNIFDISRRSNRQQAMQQKRAFPYLKAGIP